MCKQRGLRKRGLLLFPLLMMGLCLPAQAGHFSHVLDYFDHNKDGKISFSESKNAVDPFFTKVDLNKDEVLSAAEQQAALKAIQDPKAKARQQREFKRQDRNQDGKVTRKEMYTHLYALFQFMDSSKDGFITIGELRVQGVKVMLDSRFN